MKIKDKNPMKEVIHLNFRGISSKMFGIAGIDWKVERYCGKNKDLKGKYILSIKNYEDWILNVYVFSDWMGIILDEMKRRGDIERVAKVRGSLGGL